MVTRFQVEFETMS